MLRSWVVVGGALLCAWIGACSGSESNEFDCAVRSLNCSCGENDRCNEGLVCNPRNQCVKPSNGAAGDGSSADGGSAGVASSGGKGDGKAGKGGGGKGARGTGATGGSSTGDGGSGGAGGESTGGDPGTGGTAVSGAAGDGAAGSGGEGGQSGSGGTLGGGTGGTAGAGAASGAGGIGGASGIGGSDAGSGGASGIGGSDAGTSGMGGSDAGSGGVGGVGGSDAGSGGVGGVSGVGGTDAGTGGVAGSDAGAGGRGGSSGGDAGSGGAGSGGVGGASGVGGSDAGTGGGAGSTAAGGQNSAGAGGRGGSGRGGRGGGGRGGGGAGGSCSEITLPATMKLRDYGYAPDYLRYAYETTNNVGMAASDTLTLDFWNVGGFDGGATGKFTLGAAPDDNFATCSRCVFGEQDPMTGAGAVFFATSGELEIADSSDHMNGFPEITLTDVTLSEVTVDGAGVSTPVLNGRCWHLASAIVEFPKAWSCDPNYYAIDDGCDCGCGARDGDCANGAETSCDWCYCPGDAIDCSVNSVMASDNALCE